MLLVNTHTHAHTLFAFISSHSFNLHLLLCFYAFAHDFSPYLLTTSHISSWVTVTDYSSSSLVASCFLWPLSGTSCLLSASSMESHLSSLWDTDTFVTEKCESISTLTVWEGKRKEEGGKVRKVKKKGVGRGMSIQPVRTRYINIWSQRQIYHLTLWETIRKEKKVYFRMWKWHNQWHNTITGITEWDLQSFLTSSSKMLSFFFFDHQMAVTQHSLRGGRVLFYARGRAWV